MSIRQGGSRFARDLENIAQLGYTEWVENVVDSTRFERIDTIRFLLCRFDIPEVDLSETRHRLDFLRIESNRQEPKTNRLKFVVTF